jgi:hypothetical protein
MYRKDGKIAYGQEVGTLTGHGPKPGNLQLAVAFSEREKSPRLGEFVVIEETEFLKRKILCRIEEIGYGDFQTTRGERERALVEKYIRNSAGHTRPLTEEEKKSLFFLAYTLRVLGEIRENKSSLKIGTDYRMLPDLTATCRLPNEKEFKLIVSTALESDINLPLPTIGKLSFGEDVVKEVSIPFESGKFDSKRTAVFARTGYGKSNLTKTIVALAATASKSGILVLDLDGEYAFSTKNPDGSVKTGLGDVDILKPKLIIYTERKDVDLNQGLVIRRIINLSKLDPWVIADLMLEQNLKAVQDFRTMKYIPGAKAAWDDLVSTLSANYNNGEDDSAEISKKLEAFFTAIHCGDEQKRPLRREILRLKKLHNPDAENLVESIRKDTGHGNLVILDLSLFELKQAIRIAQTVLSRIFNYNLWGVTQNKAKPVIVVLEEAQNVLNKKAVEEGESVFVRWAKEGRKFQLGLIYITQQPGAIAEEIVSQTDNFFVMHLLNKGDIDSLTRANRHYDGVIAQFLGDETVVGNAYIYSAPKQPYVFPCQLLEFTPKVFEDSFGKFDLKELATFLKDKKFTLNTEDIKKAVGAFSKIMYDYFMNQKDKCRPNWLDHEKKWIDYGYAQSLLKILDKSKLFPVPALSVLLGNNVDRGDQDEPLDDGEE